MSYEPKFKIVSQLFGYCEDGQTAYEILRKIHECNVLIALITPNSIDKSSRKHIGDINKYATNQITGQ